MAPEYAMGGRFSEKSDVFSFGVLVLEIISGRKNTSFYNDELSLGLLGYVGALELISNSSVIRLSIAKSSFLILMKFFLIFFSRGNCGTNTILWI